MKMLLAWHHGGKKAWNSGHVGAHEEKASYD